MKLSIVLIISWFSVIAFSQSKKTDKTNIDSLMSTYANQNKGTMSGYRVQMYYGNNQMQSKRDADIIKAEFLDSFPDDRAYLEYEAPFWRLCVGDYRNYRDAKKASFDIASKLPQYAGVLIIIPNQVINLPSLN